MTDMQETQGAPELPGSHETPATQDTRDTQSSQAEPTPSDPDDITPPLASLIASIRAAVVRDASTEARATGATACRSILAVLEAKPGQPLAAAPLPATSSASPIANLLSQPGFLSKLAAMSREQLLDLVKQVTSAMSPRTPTPTTAGPRFHLIQIPQVRRPGGGP